MKHIIIPTANTTPKCQEYLDNCLDSIKRGGYYDNGYHVVVAYDTAQKSSKTTSKTSTKGTSL